MVQGGAMISTDRTEQRARASVSEGPRRDLQELNCHDAVEKVKALPLGEEQLLTVSVSVVEGAAGSSVALTASFSHAALTCCRALVCSS